MEDVQVVLAHPRRRPVADATTDLGEEVSPLVGAHRDVARVRVQQSDVLLGRVGVGDHIPLDDRIGETAARRDLGGQVVDDLVGSRWANLGVSFADGGVRLLDLLEEVVSAGRLHVVGADDAEDPGGAEQPSRLLESDVRVQPVPGGGGEDQLVRDGGRLPLLEVSGHHLDVAEGLKLAARHVGERSAQVDRGDVPAATRERSRCLTRTAADLQHPRRSGSCPTVRGRRRGPLDNRGGPAHTAAPPGRTCASDARDRPPRALSSRVLTAGRETACRAAPPRPA